MAITQSYPDLYDGTARYPDLYNALRYVLQADFRFPPDAPDVDDFPAWLVPPDTEDGTTIPELVVDDKVFFAAVYGILYAEMNISKPSYGHTAKGPGDVQIGTLIIAPRFVEAVTDGVKRFNANKELFRKVFEVLLEEGAERNTEGEVVKVVLRPAHLAQVTSRLIDNAVAPDHPQIRRFIVDALSLVLRTRGDGRPMDLEIVLPALDDGTTVDIVSANINAVAAVYFSAMLEEMKLHAVADKVAEHFMVGMLPITKGPAGERLFDWIKGATDRFSEIERRSIYARVLGLAQGNVTDVMTNREFPDLWLRFLSTVSRYAREQEATVLGAPGIALEQAQKAARDLAVNLSLHGYAIAHFAGLEMKDLVTQLKEMLSQDELLMSYGVNDVWQLVDRVSTMYLGGAANGVRYRTMAQSGGEIILWLGRKAPEIAAATSVGTDFFKEVIPHVERWLAVTATPEESVEQFTRPVDLPSQPVIPPLTPAGNGLAGLAGGALRGTLERIGTLPVAPPPFPQAPVAPIRMASPVPPRPPVGIRPVLEPAQA